MEGKAKFIFPVARGLTLRIVGLIEGAA